MPYGQLFISGGSADRLRELAVPFEHELWRRLARDQQSGARVGGRAIRGGELRELSQHDLVLDSDLRSLYDRLAVDGLAPVGAGRKGSGVHGLSPRK